jgi:hypothetical protein
MVGFYVSYFVNQQASSSRRATVLSFKGLAYNLSYGFIGLVYAGLLEVKRTGIDAVGMDPQGVENMVFRETFFWFPLTLTAGLVLMTAGVAALRARRR